MIHIEAEIPDVADTPVGRLVARLPEINRDAMQEALARGLDAARATMRPGGGGPRRRSGRLAASLSARLEQVGTEVRGVLGSDAPYAAAQEFGATIQAKNAAYLKFRVQGRWVAVKRVVLPARPFLGPGSQVAAEDLEQLITQAIVEECS